MTKNSITPASAAQIATIKQLDKKSIALGRRINRPYIILLNSFIAPFLTDIFMKKIDSTIYKLQEALRTGLEEGIAGAISRVMRPFLPKLKGYIAAFEALQHDTQRTLFSSSTSIPPASLPDIKKKLLNIFQDLRTTLKAYNYQPLTEQMGNIISEHTWIIKSIQTLPELSKKISQLIFQFKEAESVMSNVIYQLERFPNIVANSLLLIPRSIGLFLTERLLSPLYNRLWPQGIFQLRKPKRLIPLELITENEARKYIEETTVYTNQQAKSAALHDKLTLSITSLLLVYSAYNFWFGETEKSSWFFWLSANAITHIIKTSTSIGLETYRKLKLQNSLNKKISIVNELFNEVSPHLSITYDADENIEQTYLKIKLPAQINEYSSNRWLKILTAILQDYPIYILARNKNSLFLQANFNLSKKQHQEIKTKIAQAKKHLQKIKNLEAQLKELFTLTSTQFQFHHDIGHDHLPTGNWQGYFPEYLNQEILQIIADLLSGKFSTQREEALNNRYFSFTSVTPLDEEKFKTALNNIKTLYKQQTNSHLAMLSSMENTSIEAVRQRKTHHVPESTHETASSSTSTQTSQRLQIRWKSATFNPNDSNCKVKPITNMHAPQNRQFLLFDLHPEDFGHHQEIFEHFNKIANNPKIVAAKGQQGLKYTSEVISGKGLHFTSPLKLKSKSELFGHVRVYTDAETSKTGETLYTCKYVAMKHE